MMNAKKEIPFLRTRIVFFAVSLGRLWSKHIFFAFFCMLHPTYLELIYGWSGRERSNCEVFYPS